MALRYVVLILSTLGLSFILGNTTLLNFSKNCMHKQNGSKSNENNKITFDFTGTQESTFLSANAWGVAISILPATWLLHRFGERVVFTGFGILSAIVTVAMTSPILLESDRDFKAFLILTIGRVLQGIAVGSVYPVLGLISAHWAPAASMGFYIGILASCMQLAPFLSNPVAGLLCGSSVLNGWPMAFWIFGGATFLTFTLWAVIYRNDPKDHPWIKDAQNSAEENEKIGPVPVKSMLSSAAVWAIFIASFANMFLVQLFIIYTPTYLTRVLGFQDLIVGLLAALPNGVQFVVKAVAGTVSDRIRCCSETVKIKIFNSVAFFGMASVVLALAFVSAEYRTLAVLFVVAGPAILGAHSGGFFKSTSIVAGQFSSFVMSCIQVNVCLSMALEPYIVGALIPVEFMGDQAKWRIVFIIHSGLLVACNIVFCIFASGEPAPWSKNKEETLDCDPEPMTAL